MKKLNKLSIWILILLLLCSLTYGAFVIDGQNYEFRRAILDETTSDVAVSINNTVGFLGLNIWANPFDGQELFLFYNDSSTIVVANQSDTVVPFEIEATLLGNVTTSVYSNDAVAVYHFGLNFSTQDNVTNDSSSQLSSGTANDGAVWNSSGLWGGHLGLDNVDGWADVNSSDDLINGTCDFTISLWFFALEDKVQFIYDSASGSNGSFLIDQSNTFRMRIANGSDNQEIHFNDTMPVDVWVNVVLVNNCTNLSLFVDGVNVNTTTTLNLNYVESIDGFNLGSQGPGGSLFFNGSIDEFRIYNRSLSATAIAELYNNSVAGVNMNLGPEGGIEITISAPANNSQFTSNETPATLQIEITSSTGDEFATCNMTEDGVDVNLTTINVTATPVFNLTRTFTTNVNATTFEYIVFCNSSDVSNSTDNVFIRVLVDDIFPVINATTPDPDNTSQFSINYTTNISVTDNNNFRTFINITFNGNGSNIFSADYNTTGIRVFNITDQVNHTTAGNYTMFIESADGHTKKLIKNWEYKILNKEIEFKDKGSIKIYPNKKNKYSQIKISKKVDRYEFEFLRDPGYLGVYEGYDEFIVESKDDIEFVSPTDYLGHMVIKEGYMYDWKWIDFNTVEGYDVELLHISKKKVKVKVYGNESKDYKFKSIGGLNVANLTIQYFFNDENISSTETFEADVLEQTDTLLELNVTFNIITHENVTSGILEFNNTNFSADIFATVPGENILNVSVTMPSLEDTTIIGHQWFFNVTQIGGDNDSVNTSILNQTVWATLIDQCNATLNTTLVNFSYFNEITFDAINATNAYDLLFNNGDFTTNSSGAFGEENSSLLCTNLQVPMFNESWNMTGTITLSSPGFITRVTTIDNATPFFANMSQILFMQLFLISASNSSTITFTWLTTQFAPIDGTMRIFRCNLNGSRTLVESTPVIQGEAIGNLELLFTPYAYDIAIGGVLFEDEAWNTCHVEASTARTFTVNLVPINIAPVIGLFTVNCELNKSTVVNDTVDMRWTANPQDSSVIEGCMIGTTNTIFGNTEFFRNCTNASFSLLRTIPNPGSTYVVRGELTQGTTLGLCRNSVSFLNESAIPENFGATGLFAVVLLILGFALLFAGEQTLSLIGAGSALVLAFLLGIVILPFITVASVMAFLIIIALVGRYSK